MTIRPMLCVILATLSHPLLGQGLNSDSAQATSRGTGIQYSMDARSPVPFSDPVPGHISASTNCCDACDAYGAYGACGGCGGCDACAGAPGGLSSWRSKWGSCQVYGAVDFMLMHRTNSSHKRPLVIDANNGNWLRSTSDLDFNFEPGFRATIGLGHRGFCCLPAWEVTYLGIFDWDESSTVTGNNNLAVAGDLGFVVNGFTLAEAIRTEYESQVHSAEVNYFGCLHESCCCDRYRRVEWLAGFRYLSLDENLDVLGRNVNVADAIYSVDTDNDLYGGQLGSRIRAFNGFWGLELLGKAGVFGNDSAQKQRIVDELGVNDFVLRNASARGGTAAFVGELGFSALARLTCNCGLRCGYNLLWVEGIALAPDQLDYSDTFRSGTDLRRHGGTFIHGFNFGLEARW